MNGLLITFEGIDGSGKTTVLEILRSKLAKSMPDIRFVFTAEPTKSDAGQILRSHLSAGTQEAPLRESDEILKSSKMEELFLFMADHSNHIASTIIPSLNDGSIIISDRYSDSTAAYQGVTLRGIVPDPVRWIINLCEPWDIKPEMTLLFALDPSTALERIKSRGNREKFERLEFLKDVDNNFRLIAALNSNRFVVIDANQNIDDVAKDAFSAMIDRIQRSQR